MKNEPTQGADSAGLAYIEWVHVNFTGLRAGTHHLMRCPDPGRGFVKTNLANKASRSTVHHLPVVLGALGPGRWPRRTGAWQAKRRGEHIHLCWAQGDGGGAAPPWADAGEAASRPLLGLVLLPRALFLCLVLPSPFLVFIPVYKSIVLSPGILQRLCESSEGSDNSRTLKTISAAPDLSRKHGCPWQPGLPGRRVGNT